MKQNYPNSIGGRTFKPEPIHAPWLGKAFAKPKSSTSVAELQPRTSIHPNGQPRARLQRKRKNHEDNLANRAETNRRRSQSPTTNPNWHGIGCHAGSRNS